MSTAIEKPPSHHSLTTTREKNEVPQHHDKAVYIKSVTDDSGEHQEGHANEPLPTFSHEA